MPPSPSRKAQIDQVLRQRRHQRDIRSCYPCRQRKVKCDRSQPCRTCVRRKHPHICVYDCDLVETSAPAQRHSITAPTPSSCDPANHVTQLGPETAMTPGSGSPGVPVHGMSDHLSPGSALPFLANGDNTGNADGGVGVESVSAANMPFDHASGPPQHRAGTGIGREFNSSHGSSSNESRWRMNHFAGENSVASIIRCETNVTNAFVAGEVEPVLGLCNTYAQYPFMDVQTPQEHWDKMRSVVPKQWEVSTFFHFYRTFAFPFNPILIDLGQFEASLCRYLIAYNSGTFSTSSYQSEEWASKKSTAYISLVLSTLASGAQFSDLNRAERARISQDFARRSVEALRLANFLFRPSPDIILSLLILGNVLQNDGQSSATWALLGCTVRLAQCLGIHKSNRVRDAPDDVIERRKAMWSMIRWQDCLTSLCHDRPAATSRYSNSEPLIPLLSNLSFSDAMHCICRCGLEILDAADSQSDQLLYAVDALNKVDRICCRTSPHLQSKEACRSPQQLFESYAFKNHSSFLMSVICRPVIRRSTSQTHPHHALLCARARDSLLGAIKTFADFQSISIVPLRTWSMVHTVLSSVLLLILWPETRNDPESRDLQQKVIDMFLDAKSTSTGNSPWLSPEHARALVVLRNAIQEEDNLHPGDVSDSRPVDREEHAVDGIPDTVAPGDDPSAPCYHDPFLSQLTSNLAENFFLDPSLDGLDGSPLTLLNSVMNDPWMDVSQRENAFGAWST